MSGFKVTPEQLSTLSGAVLRTSGEVRADHQTLRGQLSPLFGAEWSGSAAAQFTALYEQFDRSARGMCDALEGIGQLQFGRYFEEFEVGAVYKHWPGKTVTEYDDHLFCLLTMNHHPLHLDAHYAAETTQFGKNVVVGNYIYSLLLGMSVPDVSGKAIANLEVESLKHVAPTFHGDTIYGETRCSTRRSRSPRTTAASSTSRPRATTRTARWSASSGAR
jgi:WXG100 family type VII secretion target